MPGKLAQQAEEAGINFWKHKKALKNLDSLKYRINRD